MPRDVLNAVALVFSMLLGGAVVSGCCINPLAHGPSERLVLYNAGVFAVGMVIGGAAWKVHQNRRRLFGDNKQWPQD